MVLNAVCLNSQTVDSRAFSAIEHTTLNKALIRSLTHFSAKRVDLSYQMSLCSAAYRRITRHICYLVERYREHYRPATEPCGGKSGFDSGMTRTNNCDIILSHFINHKFHSRIVSRETLFSDTKS